MMEYARRGGQPCQCPHQDANILQSLLKPNCQSHNHHHGDNSNMTNTSSHCHPSGQASSNKSVHSPAVALRTAQNIAASQDLVVRKSYSAHVTADTLLRDYPSQPMTQQDRDIWQARHRHCQQNIQMSKQNSEYYQYQQQQQQQLRQQQQRLEQQHVRQQLQEQLQQQQQLRLQFYHQRALSTTPHKLLQEGGLRPSPTQLASSPHPPSVTRNSPPRSPPTLERYPLVSSVDQTVTAATSPFRADDFADDLGRPRTSSVSSHGSSRSSGQFSLGDASSYSPFHDVDSGYSSSSSASPCVTATDADAYHPSMSPNVPDAARNGDIAATDSGMGTCDNNKLYRILRGEKLETSLDFLSSKESHCLDLSGGSSNHRISGGETRGVKRAFETYPAPEQDVPMDLTCKKTKLDCLSGDETKNIDNLIRHSQANTRKEPWSFDLTEEKPQTISGRPVIPGSMLKSLLYGCLSSGAAAPLAGSGVSDTDTSTPPPFATGNTRVTIAKKNLFPVSARVSDWLLKSVQFAQSLPEFSELCHNDKVTLLLNSWPRLLLLQMAETNFQFAVTPVLSCDPAPGGDADLRKGNTRLGAESSSAETPTMSAVEKIQGFIKKCQCMTLDSKEYTLLKSATLFNTGYTGGVDDVAYVEEVNSCVRQALQDHIRVTQKGEMLRYSQMLMCLPTLFGINCKMVETLFCKHITVNMDVDVLLKEMLSRKID